MARISVYIAGPLFSQAELMFNAQLADDLAVAFDVYLPQRDGRLLVEMIRRGEQPEKAAKAVFENDLAAIRNCDLLVIVLDGRSVDEGAAFELGYAYAIGKPCYGLQTDPRRLLPFGNNPMLQHALKAVVSNVRDLMRVMPTPDG